MAIASCVDCKRNYRARQGDNGRCRHCAAEQREADCECAAAMRMSVLVFGTNDPDALMKA